MKSPTTYEKKVQKNKIDSGSYKLDMYMKNNYYPALLSLSSDDDSKNIQKGLVAEIKKISSKVYDQLDAPDGPVYYMSAIGKGGKKISVPKLRTMYARADLALYYCEYLNKKYATNLLVREHGLGKRVDDFRISPIGKMLRKTHIDEILQVLLIAKGDMNFVGPRAKIDREADAYKANNPQLRKKYQEFGPGFVPPVYVFAHYATINTLSNEKKEEIFYTLLENKKGIERKKFLLWCFYTGLKNFFLGKMSGK